jgi:twitching motility protein PilT
VTPAPREGKTFQIPAMMQTGKSFGMKMMNDCLSELVEKGAVTVEEALAKAIDKESLRARLRSRGLLAA